MYIKASQQERDLSISAIYNEHQLISAIKQIATEILDGIMMHELSIDDNPENIIINLNRMFNPEDDSPEENAARLNFLIENTKDVLKEINNDKEIDISGYTTPNYNLTLSLTIPNSKYYLSAYSNIDDDMLWDELIEWVEDQDPSEKKGN